MAEDIDEDEAVAPAPKTVEIKPQTLKDSITLTPGEVRRSEAMGQAERALIQVMESLATATGADLAGRPRITWRCEIEQQVIRKPQGMSWEEWESILGAVRRRIERRIGPVLIDVVPLPEEESHG